MKEKTLYLFDSFALIYRAYFAMVKIPLINSKGQNTSAISGYLNNILEILQKFDPSHIACCFDAAVITDRQIEHDFYKANRQETPEDIKFAIPYIKKIVKALNIPLIEVDGYEADDVMGAIARQAEALDYTVYLVTPDKDMCQLVSEKVLIHKPPFMGKPYEILGVKEVCEKWEIDDPLKVIDILGLWGDAVDNIPGIPGVGEKTSKALIQQFGSVENIIANSHQLKGKLKENVENFKEQALISKKLATIIVDAPVTFDEESFAVKDFNKEALNELFVELEFRTLGKRLLGDAYTVNTPANTPKPKTKPLSTQGTLFDFETKDSEDVTFDNKGKNIDNTKHQYTIIKSSEEFEKLTTKIKDKGKFAFDTETTGLNALTAEIVGMSFAIEVTEAFYIPFNYIGEDERNKIISQLKALLADTALTIVGQNLKYDLLILKSKGIESYNQIEDTMLAHYILEPDQKHNMNYLAETYLGYTPVSITSLIGAKGNKQGNMKDVPLEKIAEYAAEDADITLQLHQEFLNKLLPEKKLLDLYKNMETKLIPVLADMEYNGVRINTTFLKQYSIELRELLLTLTDKIHNLAQVPFNIESPRQLGEVLFDKLKIKYTEKMTKTNQYATGEEVLQKIIHEHEIIPYILEYRELAKLKSTYVDTLPELIDPLTSRIHTTFNQAIAATGRLSSTNPNLQNIPIRTENGRKIRAAFVAKDEDHILLSADYSQIELRIVASIAEDEKMMQAFIEKADIHATTAANVYNIDLNSVTKEMRRNAKMVNFGIIYGISAFGLAQRLGISRSEAGALIHAYFEQYKGIKTYMENAVINAKKLGYAETILGRRRYIRDINSANATIRGFAERNAINAPIQGSAADMIKIAMINIHKEFIAQKLRSKMILQVHDELLFDVYKPEESIAKEIIINKMCSAMPLKIPVEVELGTGVDWLQAH
jgi:DNA polymerase-1